MRLADDGTESMSVRPGQVVEHAAAVRQLVDRAHQAHAAARVATLDSGAYGLMCSVLPRVLMPIQANMVSVMRLAADELGGVGAALQAVADAYLASDANAQARIGGAGGRPG